MGPVVGLLLAGLVSAALAKPGLLSAPLIATLTSTAAVGPDGRILDTPEVAVAKAEHAAAHLNERLRLADAAARSVSAQSIQVLAAPATILVPGAPIGPDGRVVDTPEVVVAKAEHAAAQANERINLANEAARSAAADLNRWTFADFRKLPGIQMVLFITNFVLTLSSSDNNLNETI